MKLPGQKLIVAFTVLLGLAVVWAVILYAVAFSPNTINYDGERSVLIPPQTSMEITADSLVAADILRFRKTFTLLARVTGWGDQIKAGHFLIPAGASNYDMLDRLRKGLQSPIRVTIPPGSRPEVVAAVAARSMAFEAEDFIRALRDTTLAKSVGTDTTHLFGFMLPETYFFYWLTDASKVVATIKKEFDRRYEQYASEEGNPAELTPEDAATIASIVEWETSIMEEKPTIAGVYLNRLRNGWRLDADPTVQYAILEREGSKRRLFFRDYRVQHPYNTYLFRGLPPGPVTNPSPSSLKAVLGPASHSYFYFVARGDGGHIFSRTLAEHNRNANNYRRLMRQRRAAQGG